MGFESPQEDIKAEEAMTPEQAELSLQREAGYGELSSEQQKLLERCNLNIQQRTALLGLVGGFQRIISGTIDGSKVEIIFDPGHDWMGSAHATIDGEEVPEKDARAMREKYQAVAEFQTKENAGVKQYKINKEYTDNKEEEETNKEKNLSLAEKIKNFLW
jgi:hypothetical protein